MKDLVGQVFGRLTVVEEADRRNGRRRWLCRCECGEERIVCQHELSSGGTRSCGCLQLDTVTTHGHASNGGHTPTYRAWHHMLERCENPDCPSYVNYGARGIDVCDEWHEFECFLADMGEKPEGLTLDRINNERGYEPGNCRWATYSEQLRNTRANRLLEFDGRTQCLQAWAEETGMRPTIIGQRIDKLGWSVERALTEPVHERRGGEE